MNPHLTAQVFADAGFIGSESDLIAAGFHDVSIREVGRTNEAMVFGGGRNMTRRRSTSRTRKNRRERRRAKST